MPFFNFFQKLCGSTYHYRTRRDHKSIGFRNRTTNTWICRSIWFSYDFINSLTIKLNMYLGLGLPKYLQKVFRCGFKRSFIGPQCIDQTKWSSIQLNVYIYTGSLISVYLSIYLSIYIYIYIYIYYLHRYILHCSIYIIYIYYIIQIIAVLLENIIATVRQKKVEQFSVMVLMKKME